MAKLDHFHFKLGWFLCSHMSQEPERNLGLKQPSRGQGGKLYIGGFDELPYYWTCTFGFKSTCMSPKMDPSMLACGEFG